MEEPRLTGEDRGGVQPQGKGWPLEWGGRPRQGQIQAGLGMEEGAGALIVAPVFSKKCGAGSRAWSWGGGQGVGSLSRRRCGLSGSVWQAY